MSFFTELKRRNVVRVGIAYVIGSWLLLQLTEVLSELLNLPDSIGPVVVAAVAIGLPIVLFATWAFELTPEGVKKESDVDRSQSIASSTGKKLNTATIVMLALAVTYLLFDKFSGERPDVASTPSAEVADDVSAQDLVSAPDAPAEINRRSIAVLPFENRSRLEDDEFFVGGIHDDLLTTLARISSLKVISRTSVNAYKDTEKTTPQIAEELGVATILEGAVQRSGNTVRINVQLIDARTDEHLWAEIFDRELTAENLFAIQSEISQKIADALEATLTDAERDGINTIATDNLEAYEAFIRGRQLNALRTTTNVEKALSEFKRAVELDPDFALGWVGIAESYILLSDGRSLTEAEASPMIEHAVERALAINDRLGEAYASLGMLMRIKNEHGAAEEAYQKAIELNPNYATAYQWYANFLSDYPLRAREQLHLIEKAAELDPRSAIMGSTLASVYREHGRYSLAEYQFLKVIDLKPDFSIALIQYASLLEETGRLDQALKYLQMAVDAAPRSPWPFINQSQIYAHLGEFDKAEEKMSKASDFMVDHAIFGSYVTWLKLTKGNDAAAREAMNLGLSNSEGVPGNFYAFEAVLLGDYDRARELYIRTEPGWLEPNKWDGLIQRYKSIGCTFAWLLLESGDEEKGKALLRQTTAYLTEDLPAAIEHAEIYNPDFCYLTDGDTERAYAVIERLIDHKHKPWFHVRARLPMFDLIRHEDRFQALLARHHEYLEEQRVLVSQLDPELGS
jgi:TolB-like protein/Tfp pilus assembly protein PilF